MIVLQLLGLGLVFHELVYLSSRGPAHWQENAAPVLGLRLPPGLVIIIHALNLGTCLQLIFAPDHLHAPLAAWLSLSFLIAAFPKRLPNHLIVSWFFLLAFTLARLMPDASATGLAADTWALGMVQAMTMLLYFIAGFHKLNADYFSPQRSCGAGFVVHYLLQRGVPLRQWPWYAAPVGIYFVVVVELLLPLWLGNEAWRIMGLGFALLLHTAFGFLAHLHFSTVMFAGLAAFLPPLDLQHLFFPAGIEWLPIGLGVPLGLLLGNHRPYPHAWLALLNHAAFGTACVAMAAWLWNHGAGTLYPAEAAQEHGVMTAWLLGGFLLNGMAPYLGLKQDFSLAMFSNLRMDQWRHFIIRRPIGNLSPRYVLVDELPAVAAEGLAEALAQAFPDRERQMFAIGYVNDVLEDLERQFPQAAPLEIGVVEAQGCLPRRLRAWQRGELRFRERISVFPFALPRDPAFPLLS